MPVDALAELLEERLHQRPPTKRPGFSTRLASNSSLSPRISAKAPGSTGPHGSTAARIAAGARRVITLPAPGAAGRRRRSPIVRTPGAFMAGGRRASAPGQGVAGDAHGAPGL